MVRVSGCPREPYVYVRPCLCLNRMTCDRESVGLMACRSHGELVGRASAARPRGDFEGDSSPEWWSALKSSENSTIRLTIGSDQIANTRPGPPGAPGAGPDNIARRSYPDIVLKTAKKNKSIHGIRCTCSACLDTRLSSRICARLHVISIFMLIIVNYKFFHGCAPYVLCER